MEEWYYVNQKNESVGPIKKEDLLHLLNTNQIDQNTLVFKKGMSQWVPLKEVDELQIQEQPPVFKVEPPFLDHSMKWYKFEVNFIIWVSCAINLYNGFQAIFVSQYDTNGVDPSLVYHIFSKISIVDRIYGVIVVILSFFILYAGYQMRHMKKDAWKLYLFLTGLVIGIAALDCLVAYFMIRNVSIQYNLGMDVVLLSQCWSYIMNMLIGISLRYVYYKKRDYLFVN